LSSIGLHLLFGKPFSLIVKNENFGCGYYMCNNNYNLLLIIKYVSTKLGLPLVFFNVCGRQWSMRTYFDGLVSDGKTAVTAETLKRTSRAKYSTVFTHSDSRVMLAVRVRLGQSRLC